MMLADTFGPYRILAKIGEGGMGEVYRAQDTRLGRDVALKVVPAALSRDSERMARFDREARLLASLNHPHIAAIYGLEDVDGVRAIAMELVEGEDLSVLIARGAAGRTGSAASRPGGSRSTGSDLTLEDALKLASQVAEALEAAHEKDIVHRDLKPGNVKVTPDGRVKVLDFGLAKALTDEPGTGDLLNSPTISAVATRGGVILGTAAYMSPEQARGRPLDRRTDIWSFGCVLYEMLTGRMAFRGDTVTDILAGILEREPDWDLLPAATPASVRRVLRRCLRKDPRQRLRDIADARMELEEALAGTESAAADGTRAAELAPTPVRRIWRHPLPIALALVSVALAGAFLWSLRRAPAAASLPGPVTKFTITLPERQQLCTWLRAITIAPGGRELAYSVEEELGPPGPVGDVVAIYTRRLDQLQARRIPGTEFALSPFYSLDGESLGFISPPDSKLMKVSLRGGAPTTIATVPGGSTSSAVWIGENELVYATLGALVRLSDGGARSQTLATRAQLDSQKGEIFYGLPCRLPGTGTLLVGVDGYDPDRATIGLLSGGRRQTIVSGGTLVTYLTSGHILYVRPSKGRSFDPWFDAYAVPFDLKGLRVTGKPVAVLEGVRYGQIAVSDTGTLAFASGSSGGVTQQLTWLSPGGASTPVDPRLPQSTSYLSPRVSPDGKQLLYAEASSNLTSQLFVRDLATGNTHIVAAAPSWWAVWTPDGHHIVYIRMNPEGTAGNLYRKASDGSGTAERLTTSTHHQQPLFVTPDGRSVVYQEESPETGYDFWILPLQGDRTAKPILRTKANERLASLSPDGHSIAYVSDETGRDEIWVRPFPDGEGAIQVSTEGGTDPLWSIDGRTLHYLNLPVSRLFAVPVSRGTVPSFGVATSRDGWWYGAIPFGRNYDVAPDGRLVMVSAASTAGNEITVVVNWLEELKRKLAAKDQ